MLSYQTQKIMISNPLLKLVARLLIFILIIYAFYIQIHGEMSPGGGFQAGLLMASAFILFGLVFNLTRLQTFLTIKFIRGSATVGLLIYIGVGLFSVTLGGKFLEYNLLLSNSLKAQQLGIFLIEAGVGLTVFSVMMIIFYSLIKVFQND